MSSANSGVYVVIHSRIHCVAVQEILFTKGYCWGDGEQDIDNLHASYLRLRDGSNHICFGGSPIDTSDYPNYRQVTLDYIVDELTKPNTYNEEEARIRCLDLGLVTENRMRDMLNEGMSPIDVSIKKWEAIKAISQKDMDWNEVRRYLSDHSYKLLNSKTCALCFTHRPCVGGPLNCDECPLSKSKVCQLGYAYTKVADGIKVVDSGGEVIDGCNKMLNALIVCKKEEEAKAKLVRCIGEDNVLSYKSPNMFFNIAITKTHPACLIMTNTKAVPRVAEEHGQYHIYFEEKPKVRYYCGKVTCIHCKKSTCHYTTKECGEENAYTHFEERKGGKV